MPPMGVVASWFLGASLAGLADPAFAAEPEATEPETAAVGDPTASADAGMDVGTDVGTDAGTDADASFEATADADLDDSSSGSTSTSTSTSTAAAPDDVTVAPVVASGGIDPFKGRFAVGAIRTIAGLNGINFRYFVTDKLAVGASAGVALFAYKENDPATSDPCPGSDCTFEDNRTVAAMAFNLEALYFAKIGREAGNLPFRADFGLGGRFGIMSIVNATDAPDNLDDPLEMHIEIPVVFQLMFGNNFALSPEIGMDFRIVPGSREAGDTNPGTGYPSSVSSDAVNGPGFGWEITPGVGLFAGASMHYVFGGR